MDAVLGDRRGETRRLLRLRRGESDGGSAAGLRSRTLLDSAQRGQLRRQPGVVAGKRDRRLACLLWLGPARRSVVALLLGPLLDDARPPRCGGRRVARRDRRAARTIFIGCDARRIQPARWPSLRSRQHRLADERAEGWLLATRS